jgi:glutamine cyclotransferase
MAQQPSFPVARPSRRHWLGAVVLGGAALAGGAWYFLRPDRPHRTPHPSDHGYEVVNTFPHDPNAFTQGLVFDEGDLFEGTGLEGQSSLRRVDLKTGRVLQEHRLDDEVFGEGIAVLGDEIFQLTYTEELAFVYDRRTFKLKRTHQYKSQGWGLTHDGKLLIMSNGSDKLVFRDPASFEVVREVAVRDAGVPVVDLNELEYIEGEVYANVYQTDRIVRIAPRTGRVVHWVNLEGLLAPRDRTGQEDVLNGIAYDRKDRRLFVTGKNWPKLFEIKVVPPA